MSSIDTEILGGEEGGAPRNPDHLRPSELLLLRRLASRFPFTPEDRVRAVGTVNEAIIDGDNWRTKLGGVRAMAELERLNLAEVGMALGAAKDASPPSTIVNVTQAVQVNGIDPTTVARRTEAALALLDAARARRVLASDGAAAEVQPSPAVSQTISLPPDGLP